jgi:glucose-1-phosphate adenylyltransferase
MEDEISGHLRPVTSRHRVCEAHMRDRQVIFEDTVAIVLAGGQGERLAPLTRDRSKPAVPFGGMYRIVDFTLSNCLNSGFRKIFVLTQYKSGSLSRHIQLGWAPLFSAELSHWIHTLPPQLRDGARWYEGTADAVFQNIYVLDQVKPRHVVVLSGDHVYKMDYATMVDFHVTRGAVATVAAVEVPIEQAKTFGVLQVTEDRRIVAFHEKPRRPQSVPGRPDRALVNMGVYCFETEVLVGALERDAADRSSRHDFGHDILPALAGTGQLYAFPFEDLNRKPEPYWRDIGTIDSYYEASMDLVAVDPIFNLYDAEWPLRSQPRQLPPAKFVFAQERPQGRLGIALDSMVCSGAILSGGRVERSIVGPGVRVNSYARVADSVLMDGVDVGRGARLSRVIVDKNVRIPAGLVVGEHPRRDRKRFTVSPGGVVVIPKDADLGG